MSKKDTGGPAFPESCGDHIIPGMTLRDWFAGQAPEPSVDYIAMQKAHDKNLNPHNDSYKPPLRTELEIRAAYRYDYADSMLAERSKG